MFNTFLYFDSTSTIKANFHSILEGPLSDSDAPKPSFNPSLSVSYVCKIIKIKGK